MRPELAIQQWFCSIAIISTASENSASSDGTGHKISDVSNNASNGNTIMNTQAQYRDIALTNAQHSALEYVRENAKRNKERSLESITKVLASSGIQSDPEILIASVRGIARVTINFDSDLL